MKTLFLFSVVLFISTASVIAYTKHMTELSLTVAGIGLATIAFYMYAERYERNLRKAK